MLPLVTTVAVAAIPFFILARPVFSAPAALALPETVERRDHLLEIPTTLQDTPTKRDARFVEVYVERDVGSEHTASNVLTSPRKRQWGGGWGGGHRGCCGW
jgi:hypothetical protein